MTLELGLFFNPRGGDRGVEFSEVSNQGPEAMREAREWGLILTWVGWVRWKKSVIRCCEEWRSVSSRWHLIM
jgi:hypothetical protein